MARMALRFRVMAAMLALLWLPVVSHCAWEHLPGLDLLGCCTSAESAPHQDDDCETDLCASVESGHYKSEQRPVKAPAPALVDTIPAPPVPAAPGHASAALVATTTLPIELPHCWQFTFRAAAPPRAPSLDS
jgi:hypothetical protein